MKTIEEGDELLAAGGVHREFQCRLHGLRAAIREMRFRRRRHRDNLIKFFCEGGHVTIVIIGATHVNQLPYLVLNRTHYLGMAVASGTDSDSRIAVEKGIAVDIFDPNALGPLNDEFEARSRI